MDSEAEAKAGKMRAAHPNVALLTLHQARMSTPLVATTSAPAAAAGGGLSPRRCAPHAQSRLDGRTVDRRCPQTPHAPFDRHGTLLL